MNNYSAKFNCPGCGSPLETLEGTISLRCSYCGLIMRLGAPGRILKYYYECSMDSFAAKVAVERYFKEQGQSLKYGEISSRLYHLPFYRFRGMSYALYSESVIKDEEEAIDEEFLPPIKNTTFVRKCRYFDLTVPAFDQSRFGLDSLGIRPEVMPLTAYQKGNLPPESIMVDLTLSPEEARQKAMSMFFFGVGVASINREYLSSEMIGEGLSVIYYPVWSYSIERDGRASTLFVDGLTKSVYNEISESFEVGIKGIDRSRAVELNPVQHKCANCGFDLPVSESSLHYFCSNCGRSYMIGDNSYIPTESNFASYEKGRRFHPFWRFDFAIKDTETVGKFSKILTGEIPLIAKSKAGNPFYLYVPAFKSIDLISLTSLGEMMCRVQPELVYDKEPRLPEADMILPESEGLELARFYWNLLRSKYRYLTGQEYDFKNARVGRGKLVWIGLANSHGEPGTTVKIKTLAGKYREKF